MPHFIGVDAGGTSCRARLTDAAGTVLGTGKAGSANTRIGIEALHATLLEVCNAAIAEAGLNAVEIAALSAGFGIAGITRMAMEPQIRALPFLFARKQFASDAMIAHLGAHQGGDGAVLILGTGSVALIKIGDHFSTIGGYGFPISDEGSGAALGLSAIRHALRALDGRTRPSALSEVITDQFDDSIPLAIAWMDQATPGQYAAFAPLVMDYADNGDEIALSIVHDAARHVEKFIETIYARGAERCVLVGGLSGRMLQWLTARTVSRLSEPLGDALDGALLLAGRPPLIIGSGASPR
jgi:glucosamine kinase